jgi:hypothetical protein
VVVVEAASRCGEARLIGVEHPQGGELGRKDLIHDWRAERFGHACGQNKQAVYI